MDGRLSRQDGKHIQQVNIIILMGKRKEDMTPVCQQWSYIFFVLTHQIREMILTHKEIGEYKYEKYYCH